jgi:hypothetical protein
MLNKTWAFAVALALAAAPVSSLLAAAPGAGAPGAAGTSTGSAPAAAAETAGGTATASTPSAKKDAAGAQPSGYNEKSTTGDPASKK